MKYKPKNNSSAVILTIFLTSFFSQTVAMKRVDYVQTEQTPLMDLLLEKDFEKAKALIAEGKASCNGMNCALFFAAEANQVDLTRLLISKGADVNAVVKSGRRPLHWAVIKNYKEITELLVKNGARVDVFDYDDWTPLHWAAFNHNIEVIELLVRNGASIDAVDDDGWTPLHWAIIRKYKEVMELLIKNEAGVDAVDNDGWTPLHWAAASISANENDKSMVRYLLFEGASYKKKGKYQKTAYDVVKKDSIKEILKDEKSIEKAIQSVREEVKREICATKCNGANLLTVVMNQQKTGSFKPERRLLSYLQ